MSAPADETLYACRLRGPPAPTASDVLSNGRTPPLEGPVLDLAFFGDDRLVVLGPDSVALYRFDGAGLALESRRPLSWPQEAVRFPGGMLRVAEKDGAFWALTSRSSRALLFAVEDGRLVERGRKPELFPGTGCLRGSVIAWEPTSSRGRSPTWPRALSWASTTPRRAWPSPPMGSCA